MLSTAESRPTYHSTKKNDSFKFLSFVKDIPQQGKLLESSITEETDNNSEDLDSTPDSSTDFH